MAAKRTIKINRKKKEPEVEVKEVTLEEALEEIEDAVNTDTEYQTEDVETLWLTRKQIKWEIVWNWKKTVVERPRWRINFEAKVAPVPMFMLPDEIRKYLLTYGLPTTVWQWDKEKLEKRKVDMKMVEKLKKFLTEMDY